MNDMNENDMVKEVLEIVEYQTGLKLSMEGVRRLLILKGYRAFKMEMLANGFKQALFDEKNKKL